ncbi:MAG: SIR2 family protein [Pseudomonadota bacterium]
MPNPQQPSFDHEATLEELAGVGKNRRFDEVIDDEEFEGIQVICKRGADEILISKPSRAFYFGDRALYDQEAKRFDQEETARILNTDQFPRNLSRFEELKRACRRGFVIPFVGAGMSKSAGCPEWKEYLLGLCNDAQFDAVAMRARLEENGDYEGVMNDIVTKLGVNRFNLDFERDFKTPEEIIGAITLLPKLFDNSAVTTNFDRVLEKVYEAESKPFVEKVTGRGQASAFFRAIPAGERYLLKLHGNLDNAAERVLSKDEYDQAYGNDGNIHFECALPKLLKRLFSSYSFLFLGCSLSADRTVQTFMSVAQLEGQDNLPHHYALLACPTDAAKKADIDQRLANAHITPLWYPDGEHDHVEQILQLLLD